MYTHSLPAMCVQLSRSVTLWALPGMCPAVPQLSVCTHTHYLSPRGREAHIYISDACRVSWQLRACVSRLSPPAGVDSLPARGFKYTQYGLIYRLYNTGTCETPTHGHQHARHTHKERGRSRAIQPNQPFHKTSIWKSGNDCAVESPDIDRCCCRCCCRHLVDISRHAANPYGFMSAFMREDRFLVTFCRPSNGTTRYRPRRRSPLWEPGRATSPPLWGSDRASSSASPHWCAHP